MTLYNADLANTLGNLVNRSIAMAGKYFGGRLQKPSVPGGEADGELLAVAKTARESYIRLMDVYHNAEALEAVMSLAKRCNKYIDETAPWILGEERGGSPAAGSGAVQPHGMHPPAGRLAVPLHSGHRRRNPPADSGG